MRLWLPLLLVLVALCLDGGVDAQIDVPLPAPVEKRGLAVEIRDLVRLPDTRGMRPPDQDVTPAGWARVSFVRDLPDGRRFANDSRGFLYLLERRQPAVGLRGRRRRSFPLAIYNRLESGFIGFDFHPEFAAQRPVLHRARRARGRQSRRRPTSSRRASRPADVTLPQRHHRVARHQSRRPNTFTGTRRELLRVAHVVAEPDASDGRRRVQPDGEAGLARLRPALHERQRSRLQQRRRAERQQPGQTQRLDSIITAILRIDPRSPSVTRRRRRASATTRFRRPTSSPPTAIRRRSARSTPTASATRTGCRGTRPTARCSPPTSA